MHPNLKVLLVIGFLCALLAFSSIACSLPNCDGTDGGHLIGACVSQK